MRVMPEQRTMVEVRSVQLFPLVTLAGLVVDTSTEVWWNR
jgi:hypothetical protein